MNSCSANGGAGKQAVWQTFEWQTLAELSLAAIAVLDEERLRVKWHNQRLQELIPVFGTGDLTDRLLEDLMPEAVALFSSGRERPPAAERLERSVLLPDGRTALVSLQWLSPGELLLQAAPATDDKRLRAQLSMLRHHLDNSPLPAIAFDSRLRISYCTPGFERLLGWRFAQIRGQSLFRLALIPEADRAAVERRLGQLLGGKECGCSFCSRTSCCDGRGISCEWYCSVSRNREGRPLSLLAWLRDLSDQERTLRQFEQRERCKDDFMATVAHEWRNYICSIKSGLQLIQRRGLKPEAAGAHAGVVHKVDHMERLVEDLLDVSRVASGKLQLCKESVQVTAIVESAVEISRPQIDQGRHELLLALPEEPLLVEADPDRLAQVISNLLINSAKYTPSGGWIRLAVYRKDRSVCFSVEDNGRGIPPEMLPRIFDMFTQVEAGPARSGLGVGLTLVKSLVELHGGRVEAYSNGPGQGSTFTVCLPAVDD